MSVSLAALTDRAKEWLAGRRLAIALPQRRTLLVIGDLAVVNLSILTSLRIWAWRGQITFDSSFVLDNIEWFVTLSAFWFVLAWAAGLYDLTLAGRWPEITRRLTSVAAGQAILYLIVFFLSPRDALPRLFFLYYLLISIPSVLLLRWLYVSVLTHSVFRQRLVILGNGGAGKTIADTIRSYSEQDYVLVGFIDDGSFLSEEGHQALPLLGPFADLPGLVQQRQIDAVVVAVSGHLPAELFQALLDCQAAGVSVVRMTTLYEALTGRVPVAHVSSEWLLPGEIRGGQSPWTYRLFVALLNWGFGLLGVLLLLVVGPVVALLVKLDSPGPVFYRQVRLGRGGVPFELLKFRSMVVDAEEGSGPQWAALDDPRVTRAGRLLRVTRLDELPQVLNILRGDIHLIGPRPERPEFIAGLEREIPYYRARLAVRPGLTGWAQVKYRYGNSVEDALIKLEYDLYYIKNRSAVLDLSILLKTIGVILLFKGT
jgi:exopolysaccharide biosynthesis polyprenyl glycosylphosphotransferase